MNTTKRLVLILAVLAVAAAVVWYNYAAWFGGEAENGRLLVSGNFEATEAVLSFKIPGRIAEVRVQEGEWVEAGAAMARLDDEDQRQQVALDQANLRVAQAQLDLARAGARHQEIEAAAHSVREIEAELAQRKLDLERAETLHQRDAGSEQAVDAARTARTRTEAALNRAREQLSQLREGARPEEIEIARATVARAREALRFSRLRLEQTELRSPTGGVVLVKQAEPGEVVAPGTPILTVGDVENIWLRAYVSETDLGRVRWGQRVEVRTDTFPEKIYPGRISFIASKAEFTPKTIETHRERVKLVYRIKIEVENPDLELKPGMPADAHILPAEARILPAGDSQPEQAARPDPQ